MKFLLALWTLIQNAWLERELEEVKPDKPRPVPPAPEDSERLEEEKTGIVIANPEAPIKATVVEDTPPATDTVEVPEEPAGSVEVEVPVEEPATEPSAPPEPPKEEYGVATPLVRALERLGHTVFKNGDRPFNLNIVGERNTINPKVDKFGCRIHVFWKWKGRWHLRSWAATTYPGSRYLVEKLLNPKGAAILKEGQWRGVYAMDLHGGRYRALCQRLGTVEVYRDGNRNRVFDMKPSTLMRGMFGINIHAPITVRAGMTSYIANIVYAASAGCQVFQRLQDFLEFRKLCDEAEKEWGNKFTYTLVRDVDIDWDELE